MSEDIIKEALIEAAKGQAGEIYNDALKPATQESGEALKAIVGLFNNVVLYPIKKANITFKYKLDQFEEDLKEKIKSIPKENIVEPPLNVIGPAIESLKYTFDTNELREMYLNLLASSMNIETVSRTHPGYVDIIKQMSSLDAKVFKNSTKMLGNIACARVSIGFNDRVFTESMPKIFAPDLLDNNEPFLLSSSIENICRLGLINHIDNTIQGFNYDSFKEHPYIITRFELFKKNNQSVSVNVKVAGQALVLSDFGKNFAKVCL